MDNLGKTLLNPCTFMAIHLLIMRGKLVSEITTYFLFAKKPF